MPQESNQAIVPYVEPIVENNNSLRTLAVNVNMEARTQAQEGLRTSIHEAGQQHSSNRQEEVAIMRPPLEQQGQSGVPPSQMMQTHSNEGQSIRLQNITLASECNVNNSVRNDMNCQEERNQFTALADSNEELEDDILEKEEDLFSNHVVEELSETNRRNTRSRSGKGTITTSSESSARPIPVKTKTRAQRKGTEEEVTSPITEKRGKSKSKGSRKKSPNTWK